MASRLAELESDMAGLESGERSVRGKRVMVNRLVGERLVLWESGEGEAGASGAA